MMFCTRCGQPLEPSTGICSVCGESQITLQEDGFVNALKSNLASKIMLLMCIFMSITVVLSYFNVLTILLTVSLWMTYSSAKSQKPMNLTGLKMTSVTITITRVLVWIAVALLAVFGIVFLAFSSSLATLIVNAITEIANTEAEMVFTILFVILGVLFLILAAVYTVFNIFFYGSVSKSIKCIIKSFEEGKNLLIKKNTVMIWLIVLSILVALEIPIMLIYFVFGLIIIQNSFYTLLLLYVIFALLVFFAVYVIGALLARKISRTSVEPTSKAIVLD